MSLSRWGSRVRAVLVGCLGPDAGSQRVGGGTSLDVVARSYASEGWSMQAGAWVLRGTEMLLMWLDDEGDEGVCW